MGLYGGLKPEDWRRWGQFTTFKENAPELLLRRRVKAAELVYCSPLVDPYQPAEASEVLMPAVLDALVAKPPARFVFQTRSPLIVRDIGRIARLADVCTVRVSFSLTTDREDIRRLYEPHCAPFEQRLRAIADLRAAGLAVHATLAPLLPSSIEDFAARCCEATERGLAGDPLHVRAVKKSGATTKHAAFRIAAHRDHERWFAPDFHDELTARIAAVAASFGRRFETGPAGFAMLVKG